MRVATGFRSLAMQRAAPPSPDSVRARFEFKCLKFGTMWKSLSPPILDEDPLENFSPPPPARAVAPRTPNPFLAIIEGRTTQTAISVACGASCVSVACACQEVVDVASDEGFSDDGSQDSAGKLSSEGEGEWLGGGEEEEKNYDKDAEDRACARDSFIDDDDDGSAAASDDQSGSDSDFSLSSHPPAQTSRPSKKASRTTTTTTTPTTSAVTSGSQQSPVMIDVNSSTSSSGSFTSTSNSPPLQMSGRNIHTTANLLSSPISSPPPTFPSNAAAAAAAKPPIDLTGRSGNGHFEDHFLVPSDANKSLTPKIRDRYISAYFSFYDRTVFGNELSAVKVSFSNKLLTTAGITRLRRAGGSRSCVIELSSKVCDDVPRMASTLLHEMCHAAQFLLEDVTKPPHGPAFQKYVKVVNKFYPHLLITTCHNYEIKYSFAWACTMSFCGSVIGRHSRSVDVVKHVCGKCKGKLVEIDAKKYYNDGDGDVDKEFREKTPAKKKQTSAYNLYVKETEAAVRGAIVKEKGEVEKGEVMRELGRRWKEDKEAFTEKVKREKEKKEEKEEKEEKEGKENKAAKGSSTSGPGSKANEPIVLDVDEEWGALFKGKGEDEEEEEEEEEEPSLSLAERLQKASLTDKSNN